MAVKRENKANLKVYFDDGASITWSIRPGGPAALDRDELAKALVKFAGQISRKSNTTVTDSTAMTNS